MNNKKINITAGEIISEVLKTNISHVAKIHGVTRQRVSQIFRRNYPDKDYLLKRKEVIKKKLKLIKKERKEFELESVIFICRGCGADVRKKERGSTSLRVFCPTCRKDHRKRHRNILVDATCAFCGKKFHPWYSQTNKRKFCCQEHYIKMLREKGVAWFRK